MPGHPKYFCRQCNNKIPIVDLEGIGRDELKDFFSQPFKIRQHLDEAERNLAEKTRLLEAHQKEIQKIKDAMARTHRLYIEEQITAKGFGDFYKPAEERLSQFKPSSPSSKQKLISFA
jgi:hypothetical protein